MKLNIRAALVPLIISYSILSINCSLQMPKTWNCENKFNLNWLWNLRNNNRCLNIIIESTFVPKCFFDQILHSKFVIKTHDLNAIKGQNIFSVQRTNCDNFIIFSQHSNEIFELFKRTNGTNQRFMPFSQIFLVTSDAVEFDQNSLAYIYENALFTFVVENTLSADSSNVWAFLAVRNILTEEILDLTISDRNDAIRYFGMYKNHPFFNSNFKKKVFRVSLFRCEPYIIYSSDGQFDGLQYRMLQEITKNWQIEHNKCDFSTEILIPWNTVLDHVRDNVSDLAMCSVWMNLLNETHHEGSTYFELQCGTFLVPKPKSLNAAQFLYLSIGMDVWCAFVVSFIVMSSSFTLFAKIGKKFMENSFHDEVYNDFSRSLMVALDVATSHGLSGGLPKHNSMKFLVCSWIIVSFVVGVGYSTGYTSLLNKPILSKPIDTLDQLLQTDLVVLVNTVDFAKNLIDTGSESNIQLAKHVIFDNDTTDATIRVKRIDKQALFVKIILNNYIAEIDNMTDPHYQLRIMRSCILNHYTVVAFKKYSSYTQYFNEKIRLLQEFGIISHWGSSIEGRRNNYMQQYFTNFDGATDGPKEISLKNLSGAFWLLLIGLGIATAALVCENLQFCWRKSIGKLF